MTCTTAKTEVDQDRPVVLFVSHTGDWGGGAEVVLLQLVTAARRAGWEPRVACPRGPLTDRAADEAIVHALSMPQLRRTRNVPLALALSIRWIVALFALGRIIIRTRASVVHANSGVAALTVCLPAILLRRPLIWHQHDIVPPRRVNRLVLGLCGHLATSVVGCSRAVTRSLAQLGVPLNRLHVQYNHVRPQFLQPPTIWDLRLSQDLEEGDLLLTMVGRIVPRKGQDVFLEAARILAADGVSVRAVIVGEPPTVPDSEERAYLERLLTLAVDPALIGRVEFLRFRDDVPAILAASDVVVMPSVNDPFPLALIEAMAVGAAVVATDSGGHAEAIEDGVTGLLVPPRDASALAAAVNRLARDLPLRLAMVRAARRVAAERYSPDILPRRLEALYHDTLLNRSGARTFSRASRLVGGRVNAPDTSTRRRSSPHLDAPSCEPTSTAVRPRDSC